MISAEQYQARQSEAAFQKTVVAAAERLGWLTLHIPNAVCNPPGIPDLFLWRDGKHLIVELKSGRGSLGPRQREWCDALLVAGFPVRVWTPNDWPLIEAVLRGAPT